MTLALTTQQSIGAVIAFIVGGGFVTYVLINWRAGKPEVGSEIELAPNRAAPLTDDHLETTRLDKSLTMALGLLTVCSIGVPIYWLAEPGRQEGAVEGWTHIFEERGAEQYEERCASCHGGGGLGGQTTLALTDPSGNFLAQVDWQAPALTTVLTRFTEEEVTHILNFGRAGVMPAWGVPGGGPLTTQQIEEIVFYLRTIQISDPVQIQEAISDGIATELEMIALEGGDVDVDVSGEPFYDAVVAAQAAIADANAAELEDENGVLRSQRIEEAQAQLADVTREFGDDIDAFVANVMATLDEPENQVLYGRLLFNNPAGNGAYNCARCHTNGFSFGATSELATEELHTLWPNLLNESGDVNGVRLSGYDAGGGSVGPSLTGGATVNHFANAEQHAAFITDGSELGTPYGVGRNGTGGMPGFGPRTDDTVEDKEGNSVVYAEIFTQDQIAAIVAYEREL